MIAPNVAALLQSLETEQPSLTLEEVVQEVRQRRLAPGRSAVLKRCSLVRSFNEEVFNLLCRDLPQKPDFQQLIEESARRDRSAADVVADGNGWWHVAELPRSGYLKEWQTTQTDTWKHWNGELAKYFLGQPGPFARVHALYHLAVANPDRALELFPKWFDEADRAFDLAQCNALLEVLRTQENWRGWKLSSAWQAHRQHYLARSLFLQDYYKTAAYLERDGPVLAFRQVFNRTEPDPWIFHLHATGGIGKTMFLRWLISRELIPAKIPCARVDFDDFKSVAEVVGAPLRLMVRIVEQLDQQLPNASLTSLLERLKREQDSPGWNPSVLAEMHRHLRGARFDRPVVIVLDTLEEPTLSHAQWVRESVDQFREFLEPIPKLTLVLSGRYNVVEKIPELEDREYLHYELTSFTELEAEEFLRRRGIPDSSVRAAIIRKIGGVPFTGANPFMLALLAELALNRKAISAEEVEKLPRVDFAYLIERIILRIESQPLRWVIRYGAMARDFTPDFIKHVLLDPLKAALSGHQPADQPHQNAAEGMERYKDVWLPDPEAVAQLDAAVLWDEMARFARDRGWISLVDGKAQVARFHPEVINPTRELIRTQPVFAELQRRAIEYFERLASKASTRRAWATAICEAIFHRFQLEGPQAEQYWRVKLHEATRRGTDAAVHVAQEVIGRDYAEGESRPLLCGAPARAIIHEETLAQAHAEIASLLWERAGVSLLSESRHAKDFQRHAELAHTIQMRLTAGTKPGFLRAQTIQTRLTGETKPGFLGAVAAAFEKDSAQETLRALEQLQPISAREQFLLEIQIAELSARVRRPETREHYLRAVRLWDAARVSSIQRYQILLRLADWYQFLGDYDATMDTLRHAREMHLVAKEAIPPILHREAACALAVNDIASAEQRLEELRAARLENLELEGNSQNEHSRQVLLLEAQIALEKDDLAGVARRCEQLLPGKQAAESARVYDLLSRAAARKFDFGEAFDHLERASKLYDDARIVTGSARCAILRMRIAAMLQGRLREAESTLRHAFNLPGARDVEVYAELEILQAFILSKSGRLEEARQRVLQLLGGAAQEWPAKLSARLMFCAFAAGWAAPREEFIESMLAAVGKVEPVSARFLFLDILVHTSGTIALAPAHQRALLDLFWRPRADSLAFLDSAIDRARLLAFTGDESGARQELDLARQNFPWESPSDARLLKLWRLNQAALDCNGSTEFRFMAKASAGGLLGDSVFMVAVKLHAAREAISAGELAEAELLLNWAQSRLASESPYTGWHCKLIEAQAALAAAHGQHRKATDYLESAARLYEQIGAVDEARRVQQAVRQESPPPVAASGPSCEAPLAEQPMAPDASVVDATPEASGPGIRVLLVAFGVPSGALGLESLVRLASMPRDLVLDRLLGNWRDFSTELDQTLLESLPQASTLRDITLEIEPGRLAELPWEIVPSVRHCEVLNRAAFQRDSRSFACEIRADQPDAVRLLLPHGSESRRESNSYQGSAGVDLERLYYFAANTVPAVSYAPTPEELHKELSDRPCAVLHIVAAVREFSGGIYLDFESTETRIMQRGGGEYSFLTPTYLDRVLASLKQPPFVILDISRSDNDAETLRRLLLRNSFADHLFQMGNTCGILACGLVDRFSQEFTAGPLVREVMNGAPMGQVARLVRANQQQVSPESMMTWLGSLGAALFTNDPGMSPFAPPSRNA